MSHSLRKNYKVWSVAIACILLPMLIMLCFSNTEQSNQEIPVYPAYKRSYHVPATPLHPLVVDCEPVRHLYYVKVAKTGSTTMSNILNRMIVEDGNITVMKFNTGNVISHKDWKKDDIVLPHPSDLLCKKKEKKKNCNHKYDMLTRHTAYNKDNVNNYMNSDTQVIATVRHPLNRARSLFCHNYLNEVFDVTYHEFMTSLGKYSEMFSFNHMAWQLGIDIDRAPVDQIYFQRSLENVKETYAQVLITELFDESLILLKQKFCWKLKTILYISFKEETLRQHCGNSSNEDLEKNRELYSTNLQKYSTLDYTLYDYFVGVHQDDVGAIGSDFVKQEVANFREINAKVTNFCREMCNLFKDNRKQKNTILDEIISHKIVFDRMEYGEQFDVTGQDCIIMVKPLSFYETYYTQKQYYGVCQSYRKDLSNKYMYGDEASQICKNQNTTASFHNKDFGTHCAAVFPH